MKKTTSIIIAGIFLVLVLNLISSLEVGGGMGIDVTVVDSTPNNNNGEDNDNNSDDKEDKENKKDNNDKSFQSLSQQTQTSQDKNLETDNQIILEPRTINSPKKIPLIFLLGINLFLWVALILAFSQKKFINFK
jgi:hypothetical protein